MKISSGKAAGKPTTRPSLVVGIGASAGGFEALSTVFSHVQGDHDITFVIVQHIDPSGEGLLTGLLKNITSLPVEEIVNGASLGVGRIYVAPSQRLVSVKGDKFTVLPASSADDYRTPIDFFFHSLAESYQAISVGVVLSGNGSDGALGLKAIGDAGGLTIAQNPATAKYESMPNMATTLGVADYVLRPEEIPSKLVAYAEHMKALTEGTAEATLHEKIIDSIAGICEQVQAVTEHNFKHYKISTLVRRIGRRMQVLHITDATEYTEYLKQNKEECQALFKEILIGVTAFFRDPEVFESLKRQVIPQIFANRGQGDTVRIWVPGCATGEEAYTLAILVREHLDKMEAAPEVQIFATDINDRSLSIARHGSYPATISEDISAERLKRFFIKKGAQYHVTKELRELCLFSEHDLIRDPPFSKLDLISCRNLLIYLGPHLQKKLIPLFHYSLRPGGYLLLGPSENISAHRDLFRPVDLKYRISQRLSTAVRTVSLVQDEHRSGIRIREATAQSEPDIHLVMQRILLDEFSPKSVVVNEDGHILCASGNLERYLTIAQGNFQNSIFKLARSGLSISLRTSLAEAIRTSRTVVHEDVTVKSGDELQRVRLTVQPMPQMGEQSGLYMVVFQDIGASVNLDFQVGPSHPEEANALIEQLERELRTTRDDLEKTIQDLEATNEELKSSNEELISMNEELQSANEELETSKEEIQAANEALARTNNDVENLLTSTQIATIFLDDDLRVQRFTPAIALIYNLRTSDIGRPVSDITHRAQEMPPLPDPEMARTCDHPIQDNIRVGERWFIRRVLPYRTHLGDQKGLVVTFTDITNLKQVERALEESGRHFSTLAEVVPQLVWTATPDGIIDYFNRRWYEYTGMSREEAMNNGWMAAVYPEDKDRVLGAWSHAIETGKPYEVEYRLRAADGSYQWYLRRAACLYDESGKVTKWFGTSTNIDRHKQAEEILLEADRQKNDFLAMLAHELRNPLAPIMNAAHVMRLKKNNDPVLEQVRDIIERQVSHMKRLLDDLLDVARITRNKIQVHKEKLDLRDVLTDALETSRPALDEKNQKVSLELPKTPVLVRGDRTRLTQVVVNLLNNAAKYTHQNGHVLLKVQLDEEKKKVLITVRDDGIGMTREIRERAFDLFSQADQTLDRTQGGLGIGLTLVLRIAQLHGGMAEAFSDGPGKGSTFVVTLPMETGITPELAVHNNNPKELVFKRGRILIVDDNIDAASSLATILSMGGHEVKMVHDGFSAIEVASSYVPEIILLDIGLPKMDGYQVAATIRKQEALKTVTLIGISGYGEKRERERALKAGFDFYLVKPVSFNDLNSVLATIAEKSEPDERG